jgi:hypothetical protein
MRSGASRVLPSETAKRRFIGFTGVRADKFACAATDEKPEIISALLFQVKYLRVRLRAAVFSFTSADSA